LDACRSATRLAVFALLFAATDARAWRARVYDRYLKVPFVATVEAENATLATRITDKYASNGAGVILRENGPDLHLTVELGEGYYSLWLYGRVPDAKWDDWSIPAYVEMTTVAPDNQTEQCRMRIAYLPIHQNVAQFYVRAYTAGVYDLTIRLGKGSRVALLADFVEIHDEMPDCERRVVKVARTLTSDDELVRIRANTTDNNKRSRTKLPPVAKDLRKFADNLLTSLPSVNSTPGNQYRQQMLLLADSVKCYRERVDVPRGREAVVRLAILADRLPTLDARVQDANGLTGRLAFSRFGRLSGKITDAQDLATAYDALFDLIPTHLDLAEIVGQHIPWVRTPEDLIAFLDYTILQHGLVACWRFQYQGMQTGWEQRVMTLIRTMGVNDMSQKWVDRFMTDSFTDLSHNGGWPDYLVNGLNRDGCNMVGGTEYTKAVPVGVVLIAKWL